MTPKLIVGLGNPGDEYQKTYHNIGAMALERFAPPDAVFRKHGSDFSYVKLDGTVLIRPLVYMNESGVAVREAMKAFHAEPGELLVLHDESDLLRGEYKLSFGGGSAGHKGIQSIIDHLHTDQFSRVRIGIRDPQEKNRKKAGDFVLVAMPPDEEKEFEAVFGKITEQVLQTKTSS